jgi:TRAP transporter 4TM/12TM fusion protein
MPTEKISPLPERLIKACMTCLGLLMIGYHGLYLFNPTSNALLHQNIHLAMALIMACLMSMLSVKKTRWRLVYSLLILVSLAVTIYIHIEYERLHMWAGFPESPDVIVGITLVLLVSLLSYLHWGIIFPALAGISVLYAFFGHHLGGVMGHGHLDPKLVLSNMGIGFEGIYGMMLNVSANVLFFFIVFGAIFEAVGITAFFQELGKQVGAKIRGGAAIGAALSSSLLGMCTGGSVMNVALAGSFTIPMMKKAGFKPTVAGGIESCASTGGGLTPPVMGIAIFIMASFLNMTYGDLVPAAVIPALGFYFGMFFSLYLVINRDKIPKQVLAADKQAIKAGLPVFVIPIVLLTVLLLKRYPPAFSAFFTLVAIIVVSLFNKRTRPSIRTLVEGLTKGAATMATLALVLGMIGIFVTMINMTSAGPKMSQLIQVLAGGNLLLALFLTMILCIILGCALPAVLAYMVVALVVAPGMLDLGVPIVATHLFCFYFSFISSVTPPIAGAAMVAAKIAEASFMKTGWEAFKFTLPFFVVPYFAIFNPVILLQPQPFLEAALALLTLLISCASIAIATWGYLWGPVSIIGRLVFTAIAIAAFWTGVNGESWVGMSGISLFIMISVYRWLKHNPQTEIDDSNSTELERDNIMAR